MSPKITSSALSKPPLRPSRLQSQPPPEPRAPNIPLLLHLHSPRQTPKPVIDLHRISCTSIPPPSSHLPAAYQPPNLISAAICSGSRQINILFGEPAPPPPPSSRHAASSLRCGWSKPVQRRCRCLFKEGKRGILGAEFPQRLTCMWLTLSHAGCERGRDGCGNVTFIQHHTRWTCRER
jgi:hypothetical protein